MTNTTKQELKPCPFCGGEEVNDTSPHEENKSGVFQWVCPNCISLGPCGPTEYLATKAWNTRAPQWQPIEGLPESEGEYIARQGKEVFHIKRMPDGRVAFRTHGRRNPTSYRTIKVQLDGKEVDARVMLSEGPEVYEHNWCFWTSGFDFDVTHWMPLPEAPGVE